MSVLFSVLSKSAVDNIIGHCANCWDYVPPNDTALEKAVFRGIKPFYNRVKALGSPDTIVDVLKDTDAFDIKGSKGIHYLKKITRAANYEEYYYINQTLVDGENIILKIPKSLVLIVKRPGIDVENWQGDHSRIISESVKEYKNFVEETTNKSGCTDLWSMISLYGQSKDGAVRSVAISLERFFLPEIARTDYLTNGKGERVGYAAYDTNNNISYKIDGFNSGSKNTHKRFPFNNFVLYSWKTENSNDLVFEEQHLVDKGSILTVS